MRLRRVPLLGLALVSLFAGLWGGLLLLGVLPPTSGSAAAVEHGPLMALGFLGTLISLERAVALNRSWAFAAPVGAGVGALISLTSAPASLGPALVCFGGLVLVAAHVALDRRQRSPHNMVMALGAIAWCAAAADWIGGADPARFAPLLAGFLVLTIVGERLELTRATRRPRLATMVLLAAVAAFAAGLAVSLAAERLGVRLAGSGLILQALWLARYDIARHTVRIGGLTRYMASALLAGYVWLLCAGVLWTVFAALESGPAYDASLHAVFLGFVMSMVFAHAPVIVPAVLRVRLPHTRWFYVQLVLLHAALAVRLIGGDLLGSMALWRWGGVGNGAAIVLFLAVSAIAALLARRRRTAGRPTGQWMRPISPLPARRPTPGASHRRP